MLKWGKCGKCRFYTSNGECLDFIATSEFGVKPGYVLSETCSRFRDSSSDTASRNAAMRLMPLAVQPKAQNTLAAAGKSDAIKRSRAPLKERVQKTLKMGTAKSASNNR